MNRSRRLVTKREVCSFWRRRGLSVLRRPAHGPWRFNLSSGRLGHRSAVVAAGQEGQTWLVPEQPGSSRFERFSTLWSFCLGQGRCPQSAGGRKSECTVGLTQEHQMPEVSTRQPRASGRSSHSFSAVPALRSWRLLAQSGPPNCSVKGTSRKRAAPYVGR
jgi:hypothetical protein